MMVKFKRLFVFIYVAMSAFSAGPVLGVQKISDDFYIGKIPGKELRAGKELWLVMERVGSNNLTRWRQYIKIQTMPRGIQIASTQKDENGKAIQKGMTGDGSNIFKEVLDEGSYTENEIWIAYITKASRPQKIPSIPDFDPVFGYDPVSACRNTYGLSEGSSFMTNIEMFMTVTSSPDALITSHMGIASSIEGVLNRRTKGTSIDLHSFAAKVMLERNPQRKYMINAPVFAMEKIMIDALPNSVFIGTRQMKKIMEERPTANREEFVQNNSKEIRKSIKFPAKRWLYGENQRLKREIDEARRGLKEGHTEESIREERIRNLPADMLVEMGKKKFVVSESKIELALPKKIEEEFIRYKNPYPFIPEKSIAHRSASFLQLMKTCPPLLSVDNETYIDQTFTIFHHDKPTEPWLTKNKRDLDYHWMFQSAFKPAGETHYMVVDLAALADSRAVEPTQLDVEDFRD